MLAIFFVFSAISVISALAVILNRNPVKSALSLVVCFFSLGGLYLLLQAEFIAVMQVLVYAGAIMVLFLFVIMFLNLGPEGLKERRGAIISPGASWGIIYLLVPIFLSLLYAIHHPQAFTGASGEYTSEAIAAAGGNTRSIAMVLFSKYLLPFEVTSVLLLVAVVGAIVLAKKRL
nr:NADH-quinone oxidoreductase subunit J [Desulfobacterales bacterium]